MWETTHPVTYDLMQLKATEKIYPIHEKELLVIVQALKKWRSDLLGSHIYIYTDHKTLENFNSKKDLSHCQLCWQEFLSQYKIHMVYIPGANNTVTDALSHLPADPSDQISLPYESWAMPIGCALCHHRPVCS